MNDVVPCVATLTKALREKMRFVLESAIYTTPEERVNVLTCEYASHQFITGAFSFYEGTLIFKGRVDKSPTEILVHS